ncbi:AsmA family protein [Shimia sp. R10_1]|uniref:AsmA family protein n=1 Tax=Shimia sp. R10_1 TaxID=2821095 RepID=UPI001ADB9033|nr:AsmA family protein [Shimia sp. R10_1]MBO9472727.1 AsmA family protein [Shimia sp. R10_1]
MKVIRGIIAAIVLLAIAGVVLIVALPGEKIAKLAADQVKAQTGRDLVFEGSVGISWYPVLGIRTEAVRFGNAPWSSKGPMFQAESAVIGVDVMAALGGDIRIKTLELVSPDVLLEVNADGQANWDLTADKAPVPAATSAPDVSTSAATPITLESLSLSNARLRYIEAGTQLQEIANLSLTLDWPERTGPASLAAEAAPFGEPLATQATIAAPLTLLQGGTTQVYAKLTAAQGQASFTGQFGIAPEAQGRLEVNAPDAHAFLATLGAAGPEGPLAASGDVTLTGNQQVSLRGGTLQVLGNTFSVQADVNLSGTRPNVIAQIATEHLRLQGSKAASDNTIPKQETNIGGWSKEPIDAQALGLIDGTITFAAEAMDLGHIPVGKTRTTLKIDNARAVATIEEMAIFDGAVQGTLVANNRNGLSVRGDLTAAAIGLKPFLAAAADIDRFTGAADARATFLSSGGSVDTLMNGLSGEGNLSVGRGTIEGIDLDRLLRGDVTGGTTVFDNMAASWTIKEGVLQNDDLVMGLPRLAATGKGTVGLGLKTIDYIFTPQLRGADGPSLMVPVKIRGSWHNPSIVPDLEAAIKSGFEADLDAIEDSLKDAVHNELGVTPQEGQSTEDALKKKLEDEAKKGLLNLLGGN